MNAPRTLLVEGWRFLPHSYAVVNQFQCLELLRRGDVDVYFREMAYFSAAWKQVRRCFDAAAEQKLADMRGAADGDRLDAVYRIAFPMDFSPSSARRTFVFGTAEFGRVPAGKIVGRVSLAEAMANSDAIVMTPSKWSRDGFIRSGADPHRVIVVPHGIDPSIYFPLPDRERESHRRAGGWDGFVFLSVGAMTANKGMQLLLKALAEVAGRHPNVTLVLKGLDGLYTSKKYLESELESLRPAEAGLVRPRLRYIGGTVPFAELAMLYQLADAYVAPYCAEGFALPVLEAIACGCPVICTAGGPTDDFTNSDFALRIESRLSEIIGDDGGIDLRTEPSFASLVQQMLKVIEDGAFATAARAGGPAFVKSRFSWQNVVERLVEVVFESTQGVY